MRYYNPYFQTRRVIIAITAMLALIPFVVFIVIGAKGRALLGEVVRRRVYPPTATALPRLFGGSVPSATPKPLSQITATLVPTFTPMPGSDFAGAYVADASKLDATHTLIRIVAPRGVVGTYDAVVSMPYERAFACLIPQGYTTLLFCFGPILPEGKSGVISLYHDEPGRDRPRLVFRSGFHVLVSSPTPTHVSTDVGAGVPDPTSTSGPLPTASPPASPTPGSTVNPPPTPKKCMPPDHPVFGCTPTPTLDPPPMPTLAPATPTDPHPSPTPG